MFKWFGIIGMAISTSGILYTKTSQSLSLSLDSKYVADKLVDSDSEIVITPLQHSTCIFDEKQKIS